MASRPEMGVVHEQNRLTRLRIAQLDPIRVTRLAVDDAAHGPMPRKLFRRKAEKRLKELRRETRDTKVHGQILWLEESRMPA